MEPEGAPSPSLPRWDLALLAGLALLVLSPVLRSGYLMDDSQQSLLPGALKVEGYSLAEGIRLQTRAYIPAGRFMPLHFAYMYTTFRVADGRLAYKGYVVGLALLDLGLFFLLVRGVAKDEAFAAFATCLVLASLQVRAFFDPLLSFFGMLPLAVAGVLSSLLLLQVYLDSGRRRWLVLSTFPFLAVMMIYEVVYPLFLLHLLLIASGRRSWRGRLVAASPVLGSMAFCAAGTLVLRLFLMGDSTVYKLNLDPFDFLLAFARQVSAGFPLSYFLANPTGDFPRLGRPAALLRFAASPTSAAVFVGTFVVGFRSLKARRSEGGSPAPGRMGVLFLLGLALATLSAVMTSLCPRYQDVIRFGVGYLPVFLQYFGVGLLLGVASWSLLRRGVAEGRRGTWPRVLAAVVLASITAVTYRSNAFVVDLMARPLGSPGLNPAVAGLGGAWTRPREMLTSALRAGLLDDVPEHSVVFLQNEYPTFHDHPHSAYFYAMHTGKVLRTVPLTDFTAKDNNWFVTRPRPPAPGREAADRAGTYRVRDVCLGKTGGYVVLSRREAGGADGAVRLFVRHPDLFRDGPTPSLILFGEAPRGDAAAGEVSFARRGRELKVVRAGGDWAVLAIRDEPRGIDASTLGFAFEPVSTTWGSGFSVPESSGGASWRWSGPRGVLYLNNATDSPRRVKLSMRLHSKGDAPVSIRGVPLKAEVETGSEAVRFVRELTLPPGRHPIQLGYDGSPYVPPSKGAPGLAFRVINFRIEDRGVDPTNATRLR